MTNDEVIADLEEALVRLRARAKEMEKTRDNPGGPLHDRVVRVIQANQRVAMLNEDIAHLFLRKNARELARDLDQEVPPLSTQRKRKMKSGLEKVNKSIMAVQAFRAKLKLADAISSAADGISDSASLA